MQAHRFCSVIRYILPVIICFIHPALAAAPERDWNGNLLYSGVSANFDTPDKTQPVGTLVSCDDIRVNDGKQIKGGTGGLQAGGKGCYTGGGKSFCADMTSYTYECAGLNIISATDVQWRDFDADEDEEEEVQNLYYQITTRDEHRGRAGYDIPLFMNAFGICRKIDNTNAEINALFMGAKYEDEWRTVHGVPAGGNVNGGYTHYSNDSEIPVPMSICCAPVILEICGNRVKTGYAQMGEQATIWGSNGHGVVECVGNNNWQTISVSGICGGGGESPQPDNTPSGGFYNPNNGGEISPDTWQNLDRSVKDVLKSQGYEEVTGGEAWKDAGYKYRQDLTDDKGAFIYKQDPVTGQITDRQYSPEFVADENRAAIEDMKEALEIVSEAERAQLLENIRLLEQQMLLAEAEERRQQCLMAGGTNC